ncbi:MAG: hypothetical protein ABFS39_16190 [Pseudomonadota bacterium]
MQIRNIDDYKALFVDGTEAWSDNGMDYEIIAKEHGVKGVGALYCQSDGW